HCTHNPETPGEMLVRKAGQLQVVYEGTPPASPGEFVRESFLKFSRFAHFFGRFLRIVTQVMSLETERSNRCTSNAHTFGRIAPKIWRSRVIEAWSSSTSMEHA